jgi:hypothetical protein
LRAYFLSAGLASAAALSVAAAALGPLPELLAAAVGILALAFVLYFPLAGAESAFRAGIFLLPLTVSFLLQPFGRSAWAGAANRTELVWGTTARAAVDRALGPHRNERILTLVRRWPREEVLDLAFGNLATLAGRRSANGYDPLVPQHTLDALFGMGSTGALPGSFFRTSPALLQGLGVRFVQAPASALSVPADGQGLGESLDLDLVAGHLRFIPLPSAFATELRLVTSLADSVGMAQGAVVADVVVRLASGRELRYPLRAGFETGEWAYDRSDVRPQVAHTRPVVASSFRLPGEDFEGHRYLGVFPLQGRYRVEGFSVRRRPGPGKLQLFRAGFLDGSRGVAAASLVGAYLSDVSLLREVAAAPTLRLYAVRGGVPLARVVNEWRILQTPAAVRAALRTPGNDPRRQVLLTAAEAEGLPEGARASRAEAVRAEGARFEIRAQGPGLLVLAESFDPGWSVRVDGLPSRVRRVNDQQMGVAIPAGAHRVVLRHEVRGLRAGLWLAAISAAGLLSTLARAGRGARQGGRI